MVCLGFNRMGEPYNPSRRFRCIQYVFHGMHRRFIKFGRECDVRQSLEKEGDFFRRFARFGIYFHRRN